MSRVATGRRLRAAVTMAFLLVAAAPASAQSRIRSSVDTTRITVGDRITLTVTVVHPTDASVAWPDSLDLAPFEVVDARLEPRGAVPDGVTSTARFSVTAFELGELELPSFEVSVLSGDGSTEALETDRFGIEVVSVGADDGGDIREIRGPLSIPVSAFRIALRGLLFMLLGAALVVGWRRWRAARVGDAPIDIGPPPRLPHEIALEALERLAGSPLLDRGEVKEWHIAASEIVRRWMEDGLSVRALEMTTWEIVEGLEAIEAPRGLRDDARRLLDQCDRVKFAKVRPDVGASRDLIEVARSVVTDGAAWARARTEGARASATAETLENGTAAATRSDRAAPPSGVPEEAA